MSRSNGGGRGSLVVVGTGIRIVGQLTIEAIGWMKNAEKLLYLVGDEFAEDTVVQMNPGRAESLLGFYGFGKPRMESYQAMVNRILTCVRDGLRTCVAFYGHPGVFAYPGHEAIRVARLEGYSAQMLPAISAEDCLFADLGIDPATVGCQSYEATDFLLHRRLIDPSSLVILWQVGVVGDLTYKKDRYDAWALPILIERLCEFYPADHPCRIYQAAVFPGDEPKVQTITIGSLHNARLTTASTLCILPARAPTPDPRIERLMAQRQPEPRDVVNGTVHADDP
jgi:hypothetical protein